MQVFDTPITTNDQSIDRVLKAGLPVMLVFLDGSPSPDLAAALDQIAREDAGTILVAKLNIKDNPTAAQRFGVHAAPAVVTVKNGQEQSKAESVTPSDVRAYAAYLLGKGPKPAQASAAQAQSAAGSGEPQPVTDRSFEQDVMRSSQPVLVDFWAPWCGPCRMTEPIVAKLAREMGGRLKVAKINVDENPVTAQRFGVQSIPTMLVVKNGRVVDRWAGAMPEQAVRSRIAPVVG